MSVDGLYGELDVHRVMLRDRVRNDAYRQALGHAVQPGDVVLDVGTGTGILSLLAVQAGAARVYAVERSSVAHVAAKLAVRNGMGDRITVIHGDIEDVRLPAPADVIVSEWLGVYAVDENLLAPVLTARDRWLKPDGRLLPNRIVSWLAPAWVDALEQLSRNPYGLNLDLISGPHEHEIAWPRQGLDRDDIKLPALPLWTIDLHHLPAWRARLPFHAALTFETDKPTRVNALAAWFEAAFGKSITLTNAPEAPRTHWNQFVFPFLRPQKLEPGQRIDVRFGCTPAGPGFCQHAWSLRAGANPWEYHDTSLGAGPAWHEL